MIEQISDHNGGVPGLRRARAESGPEPPGSQDDRSASACRAEFYGLLDSLQNVADAIRADMGVLERCEGGGLGRKDWTLIDGNAPEALVTPSFLDKFPQQNGKFAGDDPFACEALSDPLLERRHQEANGG